MPELPEVEVTRRTLLKFIENKVIKNIKINNPNLRFKIPENFKKIIIGQKIVNILRRSFLRCVISVSKLKPNSWIFLILFKDGKGMCLGLMLIIPFSYFISILDLYHFLRI